MRRLLVSLVAALVAAFLAAGALVMPSASATTHPASRSVTSQAPNPTPSDPAYTLRDLANMANAFGRITGPGGQLLNPRYLLELVQQIPLKYVNQLLKQVANPTRLSLTAGSLVPGWNVGNPLRAKWSGTRGQSQAVAFTNRYGALLRGHVWAPKPGARDPYTGEVLTGPFPGVVITEGSIQGSEGFYEWLAQDLAERGYVVLTYDVQGQGTSETLPYTKDAPLPFCNILGPKLEGESTGCPGVPFQQASNFIVGTEDALSFFTSTPSDNYANPRSALAKVDKFNPYWQLFDSSPDPDTVTPGRDTRIAIIGHSLGAGAVSHVQAVDDRVAAVVALDKLGSNGNEPVVPALAVQSEYGLTVSPWFLSGGGLVSLTPAFNGPDPMRERRSGYDGWSAAGVDTMLVVPRASTHMEYTDIPLVMPASRYGQDLTSVYVQRWLDKYLKHRGTNDDLLATQFTYLEPVGGNQWKPVTLKRDDLLSFYYCSAYDIRDAGGEDVDGDIAGVGCN